MGFEYQEFSTPTFIPIPQQTHPYSTEYCSNIINIVITLQYCRNIAAMQQ